MQTLQQRYAAKVYERIQSVLTDYPGKENKKKRDEYGALALKLPVLVRQAGLIQALTFVAARYSSQHDAHKYRILDDLALVLGMGSGDDLLKQARTVLLPKYMFLTQQVLWALEWFKRFAQSELKVEPGEGE